MERCFYMHMREKDFVHFLPRFQYLTRADPIYDRHTCPLKLRFHATGMPPLRHARNPTFHLVFYDKFPSPNSPSFLEKVCSGSRRDRTHPSLDYTSSSSSPLRSKTLVGKIDLHLDLDFSLLLSKESRFHRMKILNENSDSLIIIIY